MAPFHRVPRQPLIIGGAAVAVLLGGAGAAAAAGSASSPSPSARATAPSPTPAPSGQIAPGPRTFVCGPRQGIFHLPPGAKIERVPPAKIQRVLPGKAQVTGPAGRQVILVGPRGEVAVPPAGVQVPGQRISIVAPWRAAIGARPGLVPPPCLRGPMNIVGGPGVPVPLPAGPGLGPFGAVHGQFVVPKPGGGYQTVDTQRGTVTAVSGTAITVKSADGFSKTYQVASGTFVAAQRDGISSIKTGQQVAVTGTVSGSTVTATTITDLSALPNVSWKPAPAPG